MNKPWPWFRLHSSEFQSQTRGMKAAEKGFYVDLLVMMHEWCGPVPSDISIISRATSTTPASAKNYLDTLLSRGLIHRVRADKLWSPASQRELENQEERSEIGRKKSSKRWQKDEENQRSDDAAAMRYENKDIERDSEGLKDPQISNSPQRSDSHKSDVDDTAARDGAASPPIGINDDIFLDGFGLGWVEKIISWSPLITVVRTEDKIEGGTRAFRVEHSLEGKLRKRPMTEDEVDALPDQPDDRGSDHDAA